MIMLALLAACASRQRVGSAISRDMDFPLRPVILWVDWAGCAGILSHAEAADAFCRNARAAGVTHLALEARTGDGTWAIGRASPFMGQELNLRAAAKRNGLRLAAVLPMFLADGDSTALQMQQSAQWSGDRYNLQAGSSELPRLVSPADAAIRSREVTAVGRLAGDPSLEVVILSGFGFQDSLSDLGPAGHSGYEAWSGFVVKHWPEGVTGSAPPTLPFGPEGRGPYWASWSQWRAGLLCDLLLQIRGAVVAHGGTNPPRLAVVADAPYPAHQRQGFNWAAPTMQPIADYPWLQPEYASTGGGHLLDAMVLGFWVPDVVTTGDAAAAEYAWWASVDGASGAAQRYLPPNTKRWGAVAPDGQYRWGRAARRIVEANDGLLVISAGKMVRDANQWRVLAEAAR